MMLLTLFVNYEVLPDARGSRRFHTWTVCVICIAQPPLFLPSFNLMAYLFEVMCHDLFNAQAHRREPNIFKKMPFKSTLLLNMLNFTKFVLAVIFKRSNF